MRCTLTWTGLSLVAALASAAHAQDARAQDAHAQDERVAVTVVLSGSGQDEVRAALRDPGDLPVRASFAELPTLPQPAPEAPPVGLAEARAAYVNAEFATCLERLSDDAAVHEALAAGRRTRAARILFWRVACQVGAADLAGAGRAAARFAAFGLEVPQDAEAASPEVETVLARALGDASEGARASLRVRANVPASVSIDGAPPACEAPCAVDVGAGDHVVSLRAPGFAPAWRLVRVDASAAVELRLDEASPERAAAQWARRWIGAEGRDSPASVRLLARAVRARRLVVMLVDRAAEGASLRGVLAIDGRIAARAEATSVPASRAVDVLRELLVRGGAVEPGAEFYESPWFWVGIGVAAAAAAAITAGLLYDPGTQTVVCWSPPCAP